MCVRGIMLLPKEDPCSSTKRYSVLHGEWKAVVIIRLLVNAYSSAEIFQQLAGDVDC